MLLQGLSQYVLAQCQAVCWAFFLATLRASWVRGLGWTWLFEPTRLFFSFGHRFHFLSVSLIPFRIFFPYVGLDGGGLNNAPETACTQMA
jgi:hypothetical protein